jgi:TRAP-type C4-dicarboxylate transport system substrate-binding protein
MRKLSILFSSMVVIMLAGIFIVSSGISEAKGPVILKMASAAMGPYTVEEKAFADRFNARAGDDYKIEYYPSEQMVKFPEILDAIRAGAAEMGALTPNAYSFNDPQLAAVELPFLFNNVKANAYAAPLIEPIYGKILEGKFNQKLLCLHHYTGLELFSTKPIKTLADWKGLLVQALSPTCAALIETLGAAPVAIPYTESYQSLEKRVVDAVLTAPAAARVFKLNEVTPYMSTAYFISASHGFSINLRIWKKMPKKIQDILFEEAQKTSKIISDTEMVKFQKDIDDLAGIGVAVYNVPASERELWKEAAGPYIEKQLQIMGDVGEKIMKIAKEANSKYPL